MLDVAIEAAKEAGKYLKHHMGKVQEVKQKDEHSTNLVTEIDRQSEEKIIGKIKQHFPSHDILAEESGTAHSTASPYRWIIDPLDGTTNFTHSYPVYAVSIALAEREELILGVIYDPNFDELFTTERGCGAYLNGRKLHVTATAAVKNSLLATGFPYNVRENPYHAVEHFNNFLMEAQGIRRLGSAALDLAYVAAGRLDGFWEVHLNAWDMAAGALLIQEAGGRVTDFDGNTFKISESRIVASNGAIHDEMIRVLKKAGA